MLQNEMQPLPASDLGEGTLSRQVTIICAVKQTDRRQSLKLEVQHLVDCDLSD